MNKKPIKEKGKIKFSRYFQELKQGDRVAIVRDISIKAEFPKRFQGRTGVIEARRGSVYVVKINDNNREKTFLVPPVHLKKMETKQ
ncbi:50S ribosomal protein L21e [Candidatus Pacearchaeota archaeon]|nr:50S ribosomal protein L21e [Candidatus Pacearchaeota archaeon]